jgi:hypothetical protein
MAQKAAAFLKNLWDFAPLFWDKTQILMIAKFSEIAKMSKKSKK